MRKNKIMPLSAEEIDAVFNCCGENIRLRMAYSILIYMGMPVSHIFSLRYQKIDFKNFSIKYRGRELSIPHEIRATFTEFHANRNFNLNGHESVWLFVPKESNTVSYIRDGNTWLRTGKYFDSHESISPHLSKHISKKLGRSVNICHLRATAVHMGLSQGIPITELHKRLAVSYRKILYDKKDG